MLLRGEKQYLWTFLGTGMNRGHFISRKCSDITSKQMLLIKSHTPFLMTRQLWEVIKEGLKAQVKAHGKGGRPHASPAYLLTS